MSRTIKKLRINNKIINSKIEEYQIRIIINSNNLKLKRGIRLQMKNNKYYIIICFIFYILIIYNN